MIRVNPNYSFIKFFLFFFFLEGLFSSCASSHASNFSNWVKLSAPNSISPNAVGIASFRRGRFGVVVFSSHFNIRLNKIKSRPGFHEARVIYLPNATVILNPIDSDQVLKVKTNTSSWSLGVEKRNKSFPLKMSFVKFPEASFVSHSANSTVVVLDPVTGDPILVGTVTRATAVRDTFHDVAYTIWPTWQGIAVHVLSDEDRLLIGNRKIHLAEVYSKIKNPTNKLSTLRPTFAFHHFKLFFDFPKTSVKDLRLHLLRSQTSIAAKPPLDRLRASLRLAQVLLGLGLGPEARAVLESAFYDDPASVKNVSWKTLLAVADLLNDRPNKFAKLVQNEGGKSPEMRLWRGIALAEQGNNNAAEKLLVHGLSIFLGYPEPLKSYFSPIIAEAFISSGHFFAAKSFLGALPSQLALGLARAQLFEALHHDVKALTAYKKLRQSRDVRIAGIATGKVVMLRYLLHHISAKKAAADLSRDLYSWRGSSNELSIRLSLASLRAKAGKLAQALHGLRRSEKLFPSDLKQLEHERQELFNNMLASGELKNLKPLKVVTILEENEDLVPAGAKGAVILKILVHRLLALDLPEMAAPVIKNLINRTASGITRSNLRLLLARVDLQSANLQGAESALSHPDFEAQNPKMTTKRNLVLAEVKAREGDVSSALKEVSNAKDSPSLAFQSRLQLAAHNWKAAEVTLQKQINKRKPTTGVLTPHTATLVEQLVTAASNAGDAPELASLRKNYSNRMSNIQQNNILEALTTPIVKPNVSLPEALRQIASVERLSTAILAPNISTTTSH